jgi:hypothetical protein
VEDREVRGGLPEDLFQRTGSQGRARRLLQLLQYPEAPPALGLPDSGEVHSASSDEPSKERGWTPTGAAVSIAKTAGLSLNFAPNLSN